MNPKLFLALALSGGLCGYAIAQTGRRIRRWRLEILAAVGQLSAMTESMHTCKEIFHNGHPTNIQHH